MKAKTLLKKAYKKESEMFSAIDDLYEELIKYFDFSDYTNRALLNTLNDYSYDLKSYRENFTITQQTDGFCFLTIYNENIPVSFVISHIEKHGKITYKDLKLYTI